jgi:hypothetical protein
MIGITNVGTLTVNNSTIASHMAENTAAIAVLNEGGSVNVIDSELKAPYECVNNRRGTVDISGSSLASEGVCILNEEKLTISNSTVDAKGGCFHNLEGGTAEIIKGTYTCDTDAPALENAEGATLWLKDGVLILTKSSTPIIGEISGKETDYEVVEIKNKNES